MDLAYATVTDDSNEYADLHLVTCLIFVCMSTCCYQVERLARSISVFDAVFLHMHSPSVGERAQMRR